MKKLLLVVILTVFGLGVSAVYASSATVKNDESSSYLFVMHAKKAEIRKNKDGSYSLTMKLADVGRIIEFSDRPHRIIKYISVNDLAEIWGEGENSFRIDPPNAVLSAIDLKPQIVILKSIKVSQGAVSYLLDSDSPITIRDLDHGVNIVIDGSVLCGILSGIESGVQHGGSVG